MNVYSKSGRTWRIERLRGVRHEIFVAERGTASEDGLTFRCSPSNEGEREDDELLRDELRVRAEELDRELLRIFRQVTVLRSVVTSGDAIHELASGQSWHERQTRAHVSLRCGDAAVDLEIDSRSLPVGLPLLEELGETVAQPHAEHQAPSTLALSPLVTSALWPHLIGAPLPLRQFPRDDARDGDGVPVVATAIGAPPTWPNRFRPSYRNAPVRFPHDVGLEPRSGEESADATALAVVGAIVKRRGTIQCALLLRSGTVSRMFLDLAQLQRSVRHCGPPQLWTPHLAGSWGQHVVVELGA